MDEVQADQTNYQMPPQQGFTIAHFLTVADIERSVDYYSKVFGGDVGALLAHFVADAALDDDQIAQLRQLLAQKKPPREKRR